MHIMPVSLNYLINLIFLLARIVKMFKYLHSSYCLELYITSVCGNYYIVNNQFSFHNYSLSDIVYLINNISSRDFWINHYIYNMQICLWIFNLFQRIGKGTNYNIKCFKQIEM